MRTIIDIHVLQTVPPSNLNRDDTGAPKTATYGGVVRSRVSSQAWKRATRTAFDTLLDPGELGTRTKRVAEVVADRAIALDDSLTEEQAWELAAEAVQIGTGSKIEKPTRAKKQDEDANLAPESKYLMFLSAAQRDALAELVVEAHGQGGKEFFKVGDNKKRAKACANTAHSVDIALFGRMVADGKDVNVDAAAQVAHAISVHAVEVESDYYTAVDDERKEHEPGAGMIGTVEFNSATLYRYAALDADRLRDNLGGSLHDGAGAPPTRRAVEAFVRGFVESMPTGKVNTFGNHTLPDAVIVKVRDSRPVNFVGAFEQPVEQSSTQGYVRAACARLSKYVPEVEGAFGVDSSDRTWVVRVGDATQDLDQLGETVSLRDLVSAVGENVAERMEER